VARLFQTFLQPLMFVFILVACMVGRGYMPASVQRVLLLPGNHGYLHVGTGIWAVAMPLIAEFQFTREIEDRLLAPMKISWLAIERSSRYGAKKSARPGFMVSFRPPGCCSARRGFERATPFSFAVEPCSVLFSPRPVPRPRCSMQQTHIGLMFSLIGGP